MALFKSRLYTIYQGADYAAYRGSRLSAARHGENNGSLQSGWSKWRGAQQTTLDLLRHPNRWQNCPAVPLCHQISLDNQRVGLSENLQYHTRLSCSMLNGRTQPLLRGGKNKGLACDT
jgi:hypothetical protein